VGQTPPSAPDQELRGGAVYTVDAQRTRTQAVAVADGRIVGVGSDRDLSPWIGAKTEVVELDGGMVLPGFHDAHVHAIEGGLQAITCPLFEAGTVEETLRLVREWAAATRRKWVVGAGWDLSLFPAANPHRRLLDQIVPDRPVFLEGGDGHSAWVNTKALELAGIDRDTPDPEGGVIERDAGGEPTGTLREDAVSLVSTLLPATTAAERRDALRQALRVAAGFGVTSIIDPGVSRADFLAYDAADGAGELTVRVLACALPPGWHHTELGGADGSAEDDDDSDDATLAESGLRAVARLGAGRVGGGRLRKGCIKVFVDGVLEGETAALLDPYLGRDGHRGQLNVAPDALAAAVTEWDAKGLQVHFHTIGDRAVRVTLDAIEAARRANGPRDRRHHLAHLQLVDPADVPRFAALDATATFQALWAYPDRYIEQINLPQVGPQRVARMYPLGSIVRAGGRIAGGSDWPVTSMNPLLAIEVALTRQDPDGGDADVLNAAERVDLETMLAAYTLNGAWLMRQERETGTIEVGKAADLVVLERDLFTVPAEEIGGVAVSRTLIAGRTVYDAGRSRRAIR
jgi:predicted amidohydrolase YtcJ